MSFDSCWRHNQFQSRSSYPFTHFCGVFATPYACDETNLVGIYAQMVHPHPNNHVHAYHDQSSKLTRYTILLSRLEACAAVPVLDVSGYLQEICSYISQEAKDAAVRERFLRQIPSSGSNNNSNNSVKSRRCSMLQPIEDEPIGPNGHTNAGTRAVDGESNDPAGHPQGGTAMINSHPQIHTPTTEPAPPPPVLALTVVPSATKAKAKRRGSALLSIETYKAMKAEEEDGALGNTPS